MMKKNLIVVSFNLINFQCLFGKIKFFYALGLATVHCNAIAQNEVVSLDNLINAAIVTYPTVLSKQALKEAADKDLTASKLRFLPNPSFNTQRNQVQFDGGVGSGNMPSTNITVSQPIWMGGALEAGYNKSNAKLNAAHFSLLETKQEISLRVITAYAEWLKAYLKIRALEENIQLHEKFVILISRKYEQGAASRVDRELGISRLHQARAELETQYSIEQSTLATISELVGFSVFNYQLKASLAKPANLPNRHEGLANALARSITIQRIKFETEAAEGEAKEVKAQALPQVSLQALRQIGNAYFPGAQGFNAYGLVMSYTPGGGLSSFATASAARDRAQSTRLQAETVKRELTDKLILDYNEYEFALSRKKSLQTAATLSDEISASYDRQYLVGRKNWLDLMNAVRENVLIKIQLADAEGSLIGSSHRLFTFIKGEK